MNGKTIVNDLTEGSVSAGLLNFAWPFMLSNLLQTLYNMVDMVIVGQYVGSVGLAAVSNAGQIQWMAMTIIMGLAGAGQTIISQYVGMRDREGLKKIIGTMFSVLALISLAETFLGVAFCEGMLRLINVPEEAMGDAVAYSNCCFAGFFFIAGYNYSSATLRGEGDSKHPFLFIAISAVMNLVLDIIFVAVFRWGSWGAAFATVISQGFSFLTALVFLYRHRDSFGFDFKPASFIPQRAQLTALLRLGIPMWMQMFLVNLSKLFVSSYINAYGLVVSAVNGVGNKIAQVAMVVTNAFGTAGAAMIGQNFGAGKHDRIEKVVYMSLLWGGLYCAVLAAIMMLFPEQIFSLFNSEADVLAMSHVYAPIAALNIMGFALRQPMLSLCNGIGNARMSFIVGLIDGVVARVGLAMLFGLVFEMGIMGFWLGDICASFMPFVICGIYFWSGKWKKSALAVAKD